MLLKVTLLPNILHTCSCCIEFDITVLVSIYTGKRTLLTKTTKVDMYYHGPRNDFVVGGDARANYKIYNYTKYTLFTWGLGQSPSQQTIRCILALKSDIWWQQF